jgi:streptogramin lyase
MELQRAVRRKTWLVEDLEGRELLSQAIQPIATLPSASVSNVVAGPDGDLWIGVNPNIGSPVIDRIGLDGSVTPLPVPSESPEGSLALSSLAAGADGNVWFSGQTGGAVSEVVVGKVTPARRVTEYGPIPVPPGLAASTTTIVSGARGDLWFTYSLYSPNDARIQDFIGRVTTAGVFKLFPVSSFSADAGDFLSLAAGADGNLWFTTLSAAAPLGRMTPDGAVSYFRVSVINPASVGTASKPSLVLTGINAKEQAEAFKVSPSGAMAQYKLPHGISGAFATYLGAADGSLWFSSGTGPTRLGRITARGMAVSYNVSKAIPGYSNIGSMAVGQDGNLYLVDIGNSATELYRVSPRKLPPAR